MIEPLTPRAGPALAAAAITATATPLVLLFAGALLRPEPPSGDWLVAIAAVAVVGAPFAALFAAPILWLLRRGLLSGWRPAALGGLGAGAGLAYVASGLLGSLLDRPPFGVFSLPFRPAMAALQAMQPTTWREANVAAPASALMLAGILLGGFLGGLVFARLAREPAA